MSEYNGHKDWDHWNVALWLSNDEPLYRICLAAIRAKPTLRGATEYLLDYELSRETPDNAKYTYERVLTALEGFEE